jgi:hypothetical protein
MTVLRSSCNDCVSLVCADAVLCAAQARTAAIVTPKVVLFDIPILCID